MTIQARQAHVRSIVLEDGFCSPPTGVLSQLHKSNNHILKLNNSVAILGEFDFASIGHQLHDPLLPDIEASLPRCDSIKLPKSTLISIGVHATARRPTRESPGWSTSGAGSDELANDLPFPDLKDPLEGVLTLDWREVGTLGT
eukprot:CAMPEP_0196593628 /NCGR_PEP_ID=MMETSP1081-20130531/76132_1 /TAXON_ID=36882 /ORGANISM="Pyramimonas amylifera, Strain CCMP720" /LENGTH=142 /DNA_ID=CAMNT_0041917659 /DNA_START=250 /DNA_END=679 /DNA_ORIENTATION=+